MSKANYPAFPTQPLDMNAKYSGLTKREYAAIAAMQGLIASCAHHQSGGSNLSAYPSLPKDAVEIADALLAELDKE